MIGLTDATRKIVLPAIEAGKNALRAGRAAGLPRRTPQPDVPEVDREGAGLDDPRAAAAAATAVVVGGKPIVGIALLEWARQVIDSFIDPPTGG
ncbi:hypothetical protein [Nocardioides sp. URHA0032]|uniref:hypothetical protein n=1 Tax=Nocardioides sp. URHA0032 TaxID=1380388 RepID=UPI001E5A54A8|nr:hypothetical protein [Nocardioides sp. URHA0032]